MKVLVIISEDWFALSHFRPLLAELTDIASDVLLVARSSGRFEELSAVGVRTRHLSTERGSLSVARQKRVRDRLASIIDEERPDVIHAIAMQTMVMASLALRKVKHRPSLVIMHLAGLGYIEHSRSLFAPPLRVFAFATLRWCVRRHNTWVLAENQSDLEKMIAHGAALRERTALIPGAGVDPTAFPNLPPPDNAIPRLAFVGRAIVSKGLEVLVRAHQLLIARNVKVELALFGPTDAENPGSIPESTLDCWSRLPLVQWYGETRDVVGVWRRADIAVLPSLTGEGMPRSILEAGSCGRPLVVSDVAGCHHFVRNGIEGLLVKPGDRNALASAIERLVIDRELRLRLGAAARRRVVEQFSEQIVRSSVVKIYESASRVETRFRAYAM